MFRKYIKPVDEGCSMKECGDQNKFKRMQEEMEKHEDLVECACCFELFPKEDCTFAEQTGYVCPNCGKTFFAPASHESTNLDLIDADPYDLEWDDPREPVEKEEEVVEYEEPRVREGEKADINVEPVEPEISEDFDDTYPSDDKETTVQCNSCGKLVHIGDAKEVRDGVWTCKDCDKTAEKLHADSAVNDCEQNPVIAHSDKCVLKEDAEEPEFNPLEGLQKEPIFELDNGNYYYVGYEDGKLFAGGATNNGIIHEVEIDYDMDDTLDGNLENLYSEVLAYDFNREDEEAEAGDADDPNLEVGFDPFEGDYTYDV